MAIGIREWVHRLLDRWGLTHPDRRPLYAYRTTADEFESLREALRASRPALEAPPSPVMQGFVLYAAEWWQRHYDGGTWAWEPLLAAIGWERVHYPELYEPVKAACRWWRVEVVRVPSSTRYLTTFACQGGLPLGLVGTGDNSVTQYLRATLRHTAKYRQFTNDPIELAQDQEHLLRPATLRRDYVFRLAADLTAAVLNLEVGDEEDPLKALDARQPGWHRTMPIDVDDERARNLVRGLIQEAARHAAAPVNHFGVERFLRQTGIGWRLGARIELPGHIEAEALARTLNVAANTLPPRLEVRVQGERTHIAGVYAREADGFLLPRMAQSGVQLWDDEAAGEIRLEFLAGRVVGEPVVPNHGSALTELPWAFESDSEPIFIGEASVSSRAPLIMVLVPEGCTASGTSTTTAPVLVTSNDVPADRSPPIQILGRRLWKFAETGWVDTPNGVCVVRPRSQPSAKEEYRVSGERFYDLEYRWPLFRGRPRSLTIKRAQTAPRAVPANEVSWRATRGEWVARPDGFGLWEARHVRNGELRHIGRIGILPEHVRLSIEPGNDMKQGHLILEGARGVKITGDRTEADITAQPGRDGVRVHVAIRDGSTAPVRVRLRLHWQGQAELAVQAPFPGGGGRFVHNGQPLTGKLAVDDLYGARAIALAPNDTQRFWIDAELRAPDLREMIRLAYFRHDLTQNGTRHEVALVELRPKIARLLAASTASDANVTLRIVDHAQQEYARAEVSRFTHSLNRWRSTDEIWIVPTPDAAGATRFEAWHAASPTGEPVALQSIGRAQNPHGVKLPEGLDLRAHRVLVVGHNDDLRIEPMAIGGTGSLSRTRSGPRTRQDVGLAEAVNIADDRRRTNAIAQAMDTMLNEDDPIRTEEEWAFLHHTLLRHEALPANTNDVATVLVTKPKLLVRCLFRMDPARRSALWGLEDELPFSWLLVERKTWRNEVHDAIRQIREQVADVVPDGHEEIAKGYVERILKEGSERLPALKAVRVDLRERQRYGRLRREVAKRAAWRRDGERNRQLLQRPSREDWPVGSGRAQWRRELPLNHLLQNPGLWQPEDAPGFQQPVLDTPAAAAWCCFAGKPKRSTVFLVKQMREHDPEWFDVAYRATWYQLSQPIIDGKQGRQ